MNRKVREWITTIIYILMGLQILPAVLWVICNLGKLPAFGESDELIVMSEKLVADEYTGLLYLLCIKVTTLVGKYISISGHSILYILQLMTAYYAYTYFLKRVVVCNQTYGLKLRRRVWFYTLFLISIPVVLQVHMAVLPYSLASSLFLILLADICMMWRKDYKLNGQVVVRIAVFWTLGALICPDYGWLALFAIIPGVIRYMVIHKEFMVKLIVMVIVTVLGLQGLNLWLIQPGSMGKIQKSWEATMLNRFVWPNYNQFGFFWPHEVRLHWDDTKLWSLTISPECTIYEFGPFMDETYGREEANKIYWEMIKTSISLDTKKIVFDMAEDCMAYLCPPLAMYIQMQGIGVSYTGWNYGRLKDYAPQLTKCYVDVSLRGWVVILAGCAILEVLLFKKRRRKEKKEWIGAYLCSVSILVNLWYMMVSGHMQDYKKVLVISILWGMLFIKTLEDSGNKLLLNE